jgi:FMNH2-dependent dimethyl sulfone monooxygenase
MPNSRARLRQENHLKLGIFSANCAGGLAITNVPESWDASWENNFALARMADEAGIEFMLPVARWLGYGGVSGFQAHSLETITWASGLLAATSDLTVFSTVHTAFIHPVVLAKQGATIDQMSRGRWGLNIVCGWNKPEYDMMGLDLPDEKAERYAYSQEWWDIVRRMWSEAAPFDWTGPYFNLKGAFGAPKPFGGAVPPILNAGSSPDGQDYAARNADFQFTTLNDLSDGPALVAQTKARAQAAGRSAGVFTTCYVVCRPTRKEAEEYHIHYAQDCADQGALEHWMLLSGLYSKRYPPEMVEKAKIRFAGGHGCYPLVGTPDDIVASLDQLAQAGFDGTTIAFVNYLDEFPYFRDEVLPRLEARGLRRKRGA